MYISNDHLHLHHRHHHTNKNRDTQHQKLSCCSPSLFSLRTPFEVQNQRNGNALSSRPPQRSCARSLRHSNVPALAFESTIDTLPFSHDHPHARPERNSRNFSISRNLTKPLNKG
jgi:hypothetical protein